MKIIQNLIQVLNKYIVKIIFLLLLIFCKLNDYSQQVKIDSIVIKLPENKAIINPGWLGPFSYINFAVDSKENMAIWMNDYIYFYKNLIFFDSLYFKFNKMGLFQYNIKDSLICITMDSIFSIDINNKVINKQKFQNLEQFYSTLYYHSDFFLNGITGFYKDTSSFFKRLPDFKFPIIYKLFMDYNFIYSASDNIIYRFQRNSIKRPDYKTDIKILKNFHLPISKLLFVSINFDFVIYETNNDLFLDKFNSDTIILLSSNYGYNVSFKKVYNKNKIYCLKEKSQYWFNYKDSILTFYVINW